MGVYLNDKHLMMIEPKKKGDFIKYNDKYTKKAQEVLSKCREENPTRGVHQCNCGEYSDNVDHITLLGRTTNSLLVHYVQCHRSEIPKRELEKLMEEP